MPFAVKNLDDMRPELQQSVLKHVIAKLRERYGEQMIDEGAERTIIEKFSRDEAVVMVVRGADGNIVGGSFSLVHKSDGINPAAAVYTYEAAPDEAKIMLLLKSMTAIRAATEKDAPIFFEGAVPDRQQDEQRGFRLIRYDDSDYQWYEDGGYHWMAFGKERPLPEAMKTAIYLQRNSVVRGAEQTDDDFFNRPLHEQIQGEHRSEYEVDESLDHADKMAVDGKMELEPLLMQNPPARTRHSR